MKGRLDDKQGFAIHISIKVGKQYTPFRAFRTCQELDDFFSNSRISSLTETSEHSRHFFLSDLEYFNSSFKVASVDGEIVTSTRGEQHRQLTDVSRPSFTIRSQSWVCDGWLSLTGLDVLFLVPVLIDFIRLWSK